MPYRSNHTTRSFHTPFRDAIRLPAAIVLAAVAANLGTASAQGTFGIGPYVAYETGDPTVIQRNDGSRGPCACDMYGSSFSHTIRGGAVLSFPDLIAKGIGIESNIGIGYSYGEARAQSALYRAYDAQNNILLYTLALDTLVVARTLTAQFEPAVSFLLFDRLRLRTGPWLSWRAGSGISMTETTTAEGEHVDFFWRKQGLDFQPVALKASGESIASPRLRGGLSFSMSYSLPLFGSLLLVPELYARIDAGSLSQGGRGVWSGGFGTSFIFSFGEREPEPLPVPPTPPEIDTTKIAARHRYPLTPTVDLYALDENGEKRQTFAVAPEDISNLQITDLTPIFYFEQGSSRLPERYRQLDRGRIETFTPDSLAGADAGEIYLQGLNILGHRLRTDPRAVVTLTGSAAGNEPPSLAKARAEAVRMYLHDVWGVPDAQLRIGSGKSPATHRLADAGAHARHVRIGSANGSILAPVETRWTVKQVRTPATGLTPLFGAPGGVRRWQLTVSQGNRIISRYSNDAAADDSELSLHIDRAALEAPLPPLTAEFTVEDSAGTVATARDTLVIEAERNGERRLERITYILTGSSDESGKKEDERARIEAIRSRAGVNARLTVAPLIEAEQVPAYTREHLKQRIASIKRTLGADRAVTEARPSPGGSPLQQSSFPEFEHLADAIRITVDNPM